MRYTEIAASTTAGETILVTIPCVEVQVLGAVVVAGDEVRCRSTRRSPPMCRWTCPVVTRGRLDGLVSPTLALVEFSDGHVDAAVAELARGGKSRRRPRHRSDCRFGNAFTDGAPPGHD